MDVANNVKTKVGTNLFGKGQRVISDAYREGWDRIWGDKKEPEEARPLVKKRVSKEGVTTLVGGKGWIRGLAGK